MVGLELPLVLILQRNHPRAGEVRLLLRTIGPEIIPQARETCSAAGKKCPQINGESPEVVLYFAGAGLMSPAAPPRGRAPRLCQ